MQPSIRVSEPVFVGLLAHAASATRLVGHIDITAARALGSHIDAIVDELSGLLGSPRAFAASSSMHAIDAVTQGDLATQGALQDLAGQRWPMSGRFNVSVDRQRREPQTADTAPAVFTLHDVSAHTLVGGIP
jgi:hypothetical protein